MIVDLEKDIDKVFSFIRERYGPEDIFDEEDLRVWCKKHGYVDYEKVMKWKEIL